jgi:hypothetical protein
MDPIIIVGAGRSGTTLLASVIGEHPDVYMIGETSFLLPRLWETFFERSEYVRNYRLGKLAQSTDPIWKDKSWFSYWQGISRDLSRAGIEQIERQENERIARIIGHAFHDMLVPPPLRRKRWAFKEIWNGGAFNYDWALYKSAFPNARYVQCLRHPMSFARSCFANEKRHPKEDDVLYLLGQWVKMVLKSRELVSENYFEVHLESLAEQTKALFDFLGLDLDRRCLDEFRSEHLPSRFRVEMPIVSFSRLSKVPGLIPLAEQLSYSLIEDANG